MDLFGPVNVLSINRNSDCLVVIDDFSRFTCVFFLSNKSGIADLIKKFIIMIENQTNHRVKALRTDNGTEFKNVVLDHFCAEKEAINTACYVQNCVLINKAQMKTLYAARTAYMVYIKKTKQIVESFDVHWLEENETDARVGPDWLFDYTSLFKYFSVSSENQAGSTSGSKNIIEDDDEEIVYRPPLVSATDPPVESSVPIASLESSTK
ncbi:hypothetical protein Lser_V15G34209 [Lactuca serriola]